MNDEIKELCRKHEICAVMTEDKDVRFFTDEPGWDEKKGYWCTKAGYMGKWNIVPWAKGYKAWECAWHEELYGLKGNWKWDEMWIDKKGNFRKEKRIIKRKSFIEVP